MDLATPLQYVKGIGPARAEMLAAKGLETVADLLYYAPFRYEDRSNVKADRAARSGREGGGDGARRFRQNVRLSTRAVGLFEVIFKDEGQARCLARWFHGERYADSLVPDTRVALFGKVELDKTSGHRLMVQPEVEILSGGDDADETLHSGRIVAVYEAAGKVSTRFFARCSIAY